MKRVICHALAAVVLMTTAHAYEGFGICNFGKESVPSVACNGPTVLKDTTVLGDVKVVGTFSAINIKTGPLNITGATDIQGAKINGAAIITGNLQATDVNFLQGLSITADDMMLHHSKVQGSMTIYSQATTPYLKMECGAIVTGNVTFDGKAGIIEITDDSIVQGKINNGSMIFVKKKC